MRGVIRKLKSTYGFIQAYGTSYFFMPTDLVGGSASFEGLEERMEAEFAPVEHLRGHRAAAVRIIPPAARS